LCWYNLTPMKHLLKVAVMLGALTACSDKPDPTTEDLLKSTTWAGTFRSKDGQIDQAFSILFWSNNDFQWRDISQKQVTGTWRTSGSEVFLTFPGDEHMVATVVGDHWTLLTPSSENNYYIQSVYKTPLPTRAALANTTWESTTTHPDAHTLKLVFGSENKITLDDTVEKSYEAYGAGVLVHLTGDEQGDAYYFVFVDGAVFGTWKAGGNLYSATGEKK
jgi:hypothetical protein